MKNNCLLCSSGNIQQLDQVKTIEIAKLYKETHGEKINQEFEHIESLSYFECTDCGLHFFSPPITGSEEFYNLQNKSSNYYLDEKREYAFAAKYITSSHHVLDIGCGKGAFSKHIEPKSFTGLEFSEDALQLAKKEGLNVIRDDIQSYSNNCNKLFDVVCAFQVLEHISDPNSFIKSALDCLRRDGLLIISVPNNDTYLSILPNSLANMPPHHVTRWPVKAVEAIGTIFNLDNLSLDYELLSDLHLTGFSNAVALRMLSPGVKYRGLVDCTLKGRIKRRFAYRYLSPRISKIFRDSRLRPRGHSVTAVFRKK